MQVFYSCEFFKVECDAVSKSEEKPLMQLCVALKEAEEWLHEVYYTRSYIGAQEDRNSAERTLRDFCKKKNITLCLSYV